MAPASVMGRRECSPCPGYPVSIMGGHHKPRSTNSMTWPPADGLVGSAPRNPATVLPFKKNLYSTKT